MVRWTVWWVLAWCLAGNSLHAAPLTVKAETPSVYTVQKGDTLWDISEHFLDDPWRWPQLWQANDYIQNPHLIYPGDQLHLIWRDGRPQLHLKRSVKLSPRVRVERTPILTLPAEQLIPYVEDHRLLTAADVSRLPRVMGDSQGQQFISPGTAVWVDEPLSPQRQWGIYRPDASFTRTLVNGEAVEVIALKAIAKVSVVGQADERSQIAITTLLQEVRQNDVLLPSPAPVRESALRFVPSEPPRGLHAQVLGGLANQQQYLATAMVVVLDRGHLDGARAGQVFQLHRPAVPIRDEAGNYRYGAVKQHTSATELAGPVIGDVMVIRPYEHFSLAVVTRATAPFEPGLAALPPQLPPASPEQS
ncbi:LysM peptidoglycan-binding domain-containing protein [Photobacterium atrarenae]|uniref:LysM peptidoglycan-binding domain-containing protein n=1 Tax=Photobacterium atrarenae TaxID=865757 RepID=A0ABY5GGK6_9GAMM|nr:LysM domain-containing protein [Photobacterium atrarenae]UTV27717.1 LysM peptidoglycan-binding domain-containing protein [Photobacterium atrarenae]